MKNINKFIYVLFILGLCQACNDPITVGTDILDGDQSNVQVQILDVLTRTVEEDSILVYTEDDIVSKLLPTYAVGNIDDPVFGKVKSEFFAQLRLPAQYDAPNFDGATLDSIVLRLPLSTLRLGGDTLSMSKIQVHKLTEKIPSENRYSNETFDFDPLEIGSYSFLPTKVDSLTVYTEDSDGNEDTIKIAPQLNIHLDPAFAAELMAIDSSTYTDREAFQDEFFGIHVTSKDPTGNLANLILQSTNARLSIYYVKNGERQQFNYFFIGGVAVAHFDLNYESSFCDKSINNENQDFSYLQGLSGTNVQVVLTDIDQLEDVIVNKAVLEFFVAEDADPSNFNDIKQVILSNRNDDNSFSIIHDVAIGAQSSFDFFGGKLKDKDGMQKYEMNISSYIQSVIEGNSSDTLYMRASSKATDLGRTIFYGSDHTTYSPKLRIIYTQL